MHCQTWITKSNYKYLLIFLLMHTVQVTKNTQKTLTFKRYFWLNTIFTDSLEVGFFSEIKIIFWAECVFSSSQVAPNVESFVVILLYFVQTQKVNCVWMTHCCCCRVDSELGLCQFYWVSIFVCILRFPGYFHRKVSNPIYACDTIKQSFSHLTSPKSHTNRIYQQMQNRTRTIVPVSIPSSLWSGSTQTAKAYKQLNRPLIGQQLPVLFSD